jgi:hypothetical protein
MKRTCPTSCDQNRLLPAPAKDLTTPSRPPQPVRVAPIRRWSRIEGYATRNGFADTRVANRVLIFDCGVAPSVGRLCKLARR